MKKCILFILIQVACCTVSIAQQVQYAVAEPSPLRITETSCNINGDSLHIGFVINLQGNVIRSGEALHLVPVYRIGDDEVRLPEILINGKRNSKYYRRDRALLGHEQYWSTKPYAELTLNKRTPQKIRYDKRVVLPAEFSNQPTGHVYIERFVEDCCDWRFVGSDLLKPTVASEVSPAAIPMQNLVFDESNVVFVRPAHETKKLRNELLSLRINFIVNRSDILPTYKNNADELRKADALLRPLSTRRETYTINSAIIRGYASPEDTYEHNLKLSQHRADNFKSYIISRYGLTGLSSFPSQGMGEDWDGLRKLVEESIMPYREKVLDIIDFVDLNKGREKQLMDLGGGVPYKFMLANLFPPLRRMEMEVSYTVRSFEEKETDKVFETRPQDLSPEELFLLARRRNAPPVTDEERAEYGREYDMAVQLYPKNEIVLLNASSAALIRGDEDIAWEYLNKIKSLPEAANNLGVYYMLHGDNARAEQYLRRALTVMQTKETAKRNLKVLELRKQNVSIQQ